VIDLETSQPLSHHLQECFTVSQFRLDNGERPCFFPSEKIWAGAGSYFSVFLAESGATESYEPVW
jgi:hypothetical protein